MYLELSCCLGPSLIAGVKLIYDRKSGFLYSVNETIRLKVTDKLPKMGKSAKGIHVLMSPSINSWEVLSLGPQNHFNDTGTLKGIERTYVHT